MSSSRIISFISASGGVGKTTLSLALAAWLVKILKVNPYDILLVDMDPTAGLSLAVMDNVSYDRVVEGRMTLEAMYEDSIKHRKNILVDNYLSPARIGDIPLRILSPGENFVDVIDDAWKSGKPGSIFRRLFEKAGVYSKFKYVILDSAPFFDLRYTVLSIFLSSSYAVVLRPAIIDCKRTLRMIDKLEQYYADEMGGIKEFYSRFVGMINLAPSNPSEMEYRLLRNLGYIGKPSEGEVRTLKRNEMIESLAALLKELEGRITILRHFITRSVHILRLDLRGRKRSEGTSGFLALVDPVLREMAEKLGWASP